MCIIKKKGLLNMNISEFDYELPEELIAQMPSDKRENARMLVLDKKHIQLKINIF